MTSPAVNKKSNITSKHSDEALRYWKQQLAGATNRIEFPTCFAKSALERQKAGLFHFVISKTYCKALNQESHQYEASLSVLLLSAFNTLLYRYTNQADILVGYASIDYENENGRLTEKYGRIFPLRTDLSKNPSFAELLKSTRQVTESGNRYKKVPLEVLQNALISNEGSDNGALYQVIFAFRNTGTALKNHAFSQTYQNNIDQTLGTTLILSFENGTNGLEGAFEYNTDIFEEDVIKRMAGHFQILLDGFLFNPQQKIEKISILSEAERNKILFEWNETYALYPDDKCIHELFEEQVSRCSDAVAACLYNDESSSFSTKSEQLTYAELNKKANQLAHYLRSLGVGPEILVGIYMKRSLEMVVALMAILKAGGAYLPLDPSHPKDRLKFMLEDSGVSILLTQRKLLQKLPSYEKEIISLDVEWKKVESFSDENPVSQVGPENLAYVIYTSGSTGLPKGTLIVHKGVVNYLTWCVKAYRVADGVGCPVNSSLGFDATVTSFLSPLMVGKQLLLLPEVGEIEALSKVLKSQINYSLIKITPAHLEILNNLLALNEYDVQVNALVIGGEALAGQGLVNWRKFQPSTRLINEYGPTETVVGCCIHEILDKDPYFENVPIGRPIANMQIYILDKHLQPVPIGVAGELYIGGAGVARGYLNRPELTAERFVSNPFSGEMSARLYKTGDIGRYSSNGDIVFMGRSDYQVKIRGYRIELGEIESALAQRPEIQQCTVMAREDYPGDKRLVAYLVVKKGSTVTTKDLKLFLSAKLPEYMIPSGMVILDKLPLTANGKIDKAALPIPDQGLGGMERNSVEGRNSIETELIRLFEKVLRIKQISIHDNVFDLGMNSMQAYAVFAQIKKLFSTQLPLSILFEAPTIKQLAKYLNGKDANIPWSSIVPIQTRGAKMPLFLIHAGAGTVLFYRELSYHLGTDQPVYGLQPRGLDGKQKFHKSIEEMARHYVDEIRVIDPKGPYFLGGYCFGAVVAFEMAQQMSAKGYKVALLANFNGVSPTYVDRAQINILEDNHQPAMLNNDREMPNYQVPRAVEYPRFSLKTLLQKSNKEKYYYLAGKIRNRIINPFFNLLSLFKYFYVISVMWVYKYYRALGFESWEPLRKYFFLSYNSEMVRVYKPKPYNGTLTIFRSPKIFQDPHLGWSKFVSGEIKTVDIPGLQNDRRQIMNEPFVQFTAKALKKQMEEGS